MILAPSEWAGNHSTRAQFVSIKIISLTQQVSSWFTLGVQLLQDITLYVRLTVGTNAPWDPRTEPSSLPRITTLLLSFIEKQCPFGQIHALSSKQLQSPSQGSGQDTTLQASDIQKSRPRMKIFMESQHPCCPYYTSSVLARWRLESDRGEWRDVEWTEVAYWGGATQGCKKPHYRVVKDGSNRDRAGKEAAWRAKQGWTGGRDEVRLQLKWRTEAADRLWRNWRKSPKTEDSWTRACPTVGQKSRNRHGERLCMPRSPVTLTTLQLG